jgi:TolB protein
MTVSTPPRPPSPERAAADGAPLTRDEIEALVEALIEEARRETRRRHRQYWALAALVAFVGVVVLILLEGGAASHTVSPALSARSSLPAAAASSQIAFINEGSAGGYCGTVWVMSSDGSGQRRLTNGGVAGCGQEWSHAWSPDGRKIALAGSFPPNGIGSARTEIRIMSADGSAQRRLARRIGGGPGVGSLAWSPDGSTIAFVRGGVYVVNADGSQERRLTRIGASSLAWSPDGRRIAFARGTRGSSEVYVVNADGSALRRLTRSTGSDRAPFAAPDWSPDGTRIAFERNWQVWVMNADGSEQRRLTLTGAHNFKPAWSPDGRRIAFERARRQRNTYYQGGTAGYAVHVIDADGSGEQRLTRGGSQPRWSPDGRRIAYVSMREDNLDIWIMNADGSGQRNLTPGADRESQPLWSPAQR